MAGAKKEKKHIVVFQDEEGNVLKTSFVSHEEAALPPEMPEKRGESVHHEIKFQGWDKDISSVKENLVVKAVYKEVPKECLEQRQFLTGRRQHSPIARKNRRQRSTITYLKDGIMTFPI